MWEPSRNMRFNPIPKGFQGSRTNTVRNLKVGIFFPRQSSIEDSERGRVPGFLACAFDSEYCVWPRVRGVLSLQALSSPLRLRKEKRR